MKELLTAAVAFGSRLVHLGTAPAAHGSEASSAHPHPAEGQRCDEAPALPVRKPKNEVYCKIDAN